MKQKEFPIVDDLVKEAHKRNYHELAEMLKIANDDFHKRRGTPSEECTIPEHGSEE